MITHGSPRFRKYVLDMNRAAMFSLYESLHDGCAAGLTPGEAFDAMLRRGRVANRPLLSRVAALRGQL